MKSSIHPKYHTPLIATCVCGANFVIGSTNSAIAVEVCSGCHPLFTGKQRLVDTARRVEKFLQKVEKQTAVSQTRSTKKIKTAKRAEKKEVSNT